MGRQFQIFRVAKLTNFGNLSASLKHVLRERPTPNADPARTPLNHGTGPRTTSGVIAKVKERLKTVQVNPDSVLCLEYMVSASPEFFKLKTDAEREKYFADGLKFLQDKHGKKNVVFSDIQLDEKTPHMSVFVVPIVETLGEGMRKRNVKGPNGTRQTIEVANKPRLDLSAKHYVGGRQRLSDYQTEFHEKVSKAHGLERGEIWSKATHVNLQKWYAELEPNMQAAIVVIDDAERVKKEQDKRDQEINEKEKKMMEKLRSEAEILHQAKAHLVKLSEFFDGRMTALKFAFSKLPEVWAKGFFSAMDKKPPEASPAVKKLFEQKAVEAAKVENVANPPLAPENKPKTAKTGLLDALKSSKSTADHQKPK